MSLNDAERRATSRELRANLALSGLSEAQAAAGLGLSEPEVHGLLDVDPGVRPELVWALRDHLEQAVRARGLDPHPYSRLTEQMRASAEGWFGLRGR